MEEIREVTVGNIGAAVGLKETRTGDTLISQDKKLPPIQLTGMCLVFIELRVFLVFAVLIGFHCHRDQGAPASICVLGRSDIPLCAEGSGLGSSFPS